jgi:hypothetical protein
MIETKRDYEGRRGKKQPRLGSKGLLALVVAVTIGGDKQGCRCFFIINPLIKMSLKTDNLYKGTI